VAVVVLGSAPGERRVTDPAAGKIWMVDLVKARHLERKLVVRDALLGIHFGAHGVAKLGVVLDGDFVMTACEGTSTPNS
jgi:hypothetical protein